MISSHAENQLAAKESPSSHAENQLNEKQMVDLLCRLSIRGEASVECYAKVKAMNAAQREAFLALADAHHVVLRSLDPLKQQAVAHGDLDLLDWINRAMVAEKARIENALLYLQAVCTELEAAGCPTTVMKSLDHYPDLGNDLDLYSTASESEVVNVFQSKFNATIEPRSWGDRMAQKWNFTINGLKEAVEVHVQRLGQMGEHTTLARRFVTRRVTTNINGRNFFVPAPEERLIVATLQRMYRHFYFRVCDLVNSAQLVDSGEVDFVELQKVTERAGIWPGVATYLVIVSDFMKKYRGHGLALPHAVTAAAVCCGDSVQVRNRFLRVPILPQGVALFSAQVTKAAFNGDVGATWRLGLLPYLASAAAVSYKITGSDKGIW